jgi:ferredoxin--NADP+ reductase
MNPWIDAKVLKIEKWTKNLFSLVLQAPISSFRAGQFTKLAVYDKINNKKIQRAYSYLNSPNQKNLEFYIVRIENGYLSNILYNLKQEDTILIKKNAFGFFTMDEVPSNKILWMFATGTGIGPYLSILQEGKHLEKFNNIALIHAVRYQHELIYLPLMKKLYKQYNGKLKIQTITSREKNQYSLHGRIPMLLTHKTLEQSLNLTMNAENSHIMLCGNPLMIKDTYFFLKNHKNMQKHFRRKAGNITIENYW